MKDITFKDKNIKFDYRVATIIECNGKFLFQKMENDSNFTLVGGRVTLMSTSKQSIIRELKEELDYDAKPEQLKLVQIAENFFNYYDKEKNLQKVHSILFIYKIAISKYDELANKNNFSVKDKKSTKLFWLSEEEVEAKSILPKLAKRLIASDDFSYDIIDDTKDI